MQDVLGEEFAPNVAPIIRRIPAKPQPPCPVAPEGLSPDFPAFAVVRGEPKPGVYVRRNVGTVSIELATGQSVDIPMPPRNTVEVSEVTSYRGIPATGEPANAAGAPVDTAEPTAELFEFTMTRRPLPNQRIVDHYRYSNRQLAPVAVDPQADNQANATRDTAVGDYLYLVKRVTLLDGAEKSFTPTPPIRVLRLNVPEGNAATAGSVHGGIDSDTRVAMTITSRIVSRQLVDVCGDVLDTYRVQIQEQFVDLAATPPRTSGNDPGTSTFWNVQFDRGMLLVREEVDTTVRSTTEVAGAPLPVTVRYKYTSTLESTEPSPLPAKKAT